VHGDAELITTGFTLAIQHAFAKSFAKMSEIRQLL
jgi:hypothetical protein